MLLVVYLTTDIPPNIGRANVHSHRFLYGLCRVCPLQVVCQGAPLRLCAIHAHIVCFRFGEKGRGCKPPERFRHILFFCPQRFLCGREVVLNRAYLLLAMWWDAAGGGHLRGRKRLQMHVDFNRAYLLLVTWWDAVGGHRQGRRRPVGRCWWTSVTQFLLVCARRNAAAPPSLPRMGGCALPERRGTCASGTGLASAREKMATDTRGCELICLMAAALVETAADVNIWWIFISLES